MIKLFSFAYTFFWSFWIFGLSGLFLDYFDNSDFFVRFVRFSAFLGVFEIFRLLRTFWTFCTFCTFCPFLDFFGLFGRFCAFLYFQTIFLWEKMIKLFSFAYTFNFWCLYRVFCDIFEIYSDGNKQMSQTDYQLTDLFAYFGNGNPYLVPVFVIN